MQTITAQAFLKYYKQNYGQGIEQLERLIRQDHVLDLDDFIQAPDQILPDFETSLDQPVRETLSDAWARLRRKTAFDPDDPFLSVHDPSRQQPVNPPAPGGTPLPPGFPQIRVAGRYIPLGAELLPRGITDYRGDQAFVMHASGINASTWVVTGGRVRFRLFEGPTAWGPWTQRCNFPLAVGDPPHTGCVQEKLTWWALVVTASVESKFTAPPFAW